MSNFFEQAFAYLLKNEGLTFTNNPADKGGATKFGVTRIAYQDFKGKTVSVLDIQNLTIEDAKEFYLDRYWKLLSCDKMSDPRIAICVFDSAVLYGPTTAAALSQKTTNQILSCGLKVDGVLGDISIKELNLVDSKIFLEAFHRLLLFRISSVISVNPRDESFRKGWTARAERILTLVGLTFMQDKPIV